MTDTSNDRVPPHVLDVVSRRFEADIGAGQTRPARRDPSDRERFVGAMVQCCDALNGRRRAIYVQNGHRMSGEIAQIDRIVCELKNMRIKLEATFR